jgi:hypothetical protein
MRLFSSTVLRLSAPCLLVLCSVLTGCTMQTTAVSNVVPGTAIAGVVHGGQQPIVGANVYLLAVNPTGYGGPGIAPSAANASVSLLKASATGHAADTIGSYVQTNATTGGFSLSGDYNCASGFAQSTGTAVTLTGFEQVYLYILGGQPQSTNSAANMDSGLLVALGPCNAPVQQVTVNEITTVATAYAFAGFASDATHIGSSGNPLALTGLNNAFGNIANLAVVSTGAAAVNTTAITRPTAAVYTIGDILAACVNSASSSTNCFTLFEYTKSSGSVGTIPSDTATAAINLAHNPYPTAAGMTALFGLVPSVGAPFAGAASSQPNDFTLGINILGAGYGQTAASGLAIDGSGNVWAAETNSSTLSEFSPNGTPIAGYTGGGLASAGGVAIDTTGNVWVANSSSPGAIAEFSSAGAALSPSTGYTGGGLDSPVGLAFDASGNLWAANESANGVSKFTDAGVPVSATGYGGGGEEDPLYVAIDHSGDVWSGDGEELAELTNGGQPISPSTGYFSSSALYDSAQVAIDGSGNVWTGNSLTNSLAVISPSGAVLSGAGGYTGGGLDTPTAIAFDGAGNAWVANRNTTATGVSEFTKSGVAITNASGYTGVQLERPNSIAVDGSGDIWIGTGAYGLAELIGAGSPVVTPLVANLLLPYTSTVNLP